jgi:hypothetical protein
MGGVRTVLDTDGETFSYSKTDSVPTVIGSEDAGKFPDMQLLKIRAPTS